MAHRLHNGVESTDRVHRREYLLEYSTERSRKNNDWRFEDCVVMVHCQQVVDSHRHDKSTRHK